jgi:hypothetical protein
MTTKVMEETRKVYNHFMGVMAAKGHLSASREVFELEMRKATSMTGLFRALTNISSRAGCTWSRESLMWMKKIARTNPAWIHSIVMLAVYSYQSEVDGRKAKDRRDAGKSEESEESEDGDNGSSDRAQPVFEGPSDALS